MEWYRYFSGFWAGMFLANFVPHFVHGISGNKFPSPFAKPPGLGLSSATVNVIWGLFNLAVGYWLFTVAGISGGQWLSLIVFFLGIVTISIPMSIHFQS